MVISSQSEFYNLAEANAASCVKRTKLQTTYPTPCPATHRDDVRAACVLLTGRPTADGKSMPAANVRGLVADLDAVDLLAPGDNFPGLGIDAHRHVHAVDI